MLYKILNNKSIPNSILHAYIYIPIYISPIPPIYIPYMHIYPLYMLVHTHFPIGHKCACITTGGMSSCCACSIHFIDDIYDIYIHAYGYK